MNDVESLAQSMTDEALESGEWIAEDPKRLRAFLDRYDSDDAARTVSEALTIISAGTALAHVHPRDAQDPLRTVCLAFWVADRAITKAKEEGQLDRLASPCRSAGASSSWRSWTAYGRESR